LAKEAVVARVRRRVDSVLMRASMESSEMGSPLKVLLVAMARAVWTAEVKLVGVLTS
jgi:hypothetical protein